MPEDTNWLPQCVPWDGKKALLPISHAGFITKKNAELIPDDIIIGATHNNSIDRILWNYGSNAFRFIDVNGNYFKWGEFIWS